MAKIFCKKCGTDWSKLAGFLRMQNIIVCQNCDEPIPELMELDKATWEEGDNVGEEKV